MIFLDIFKFSRKVHKSSTTITELCCKLLIKKLHASATIPKGTDISCQWWHLAWETGCQYFDYSRLTVPSELNNNLTYGLAMKRQEHVTFYPDWLRQCTGLAPANHQNSAIPQILVIIWIGAIIWHGPGIWQASFPTFNKVMVSENHLLLGWCSYGVTISPTRV